MWQRDACWTKVNMKQQPEIATFFRQLQGCGSK
jgi:hypothetical protein